MEKLSFTYGRYSLKYSDDPEKGKDILRYEKAYKIHKFASIKTHPFYKDYLSKFDPRFELVRPDGIDMPPQQWELLIRLIIGSLSCSYYLVLDEEWKRNPTDNIRAQIGISVESGGRHAGSLVNELLWFQVIRLFETYFSEQISIQLMCCEDVDTYIPDDDKAVQEEREERLKQFEKKQNILLSEAKSFIELQQLMRPS